MKLGMGMDLILHANVCTPAYTKSQQSSSKIYYKSIHTITDALDMRKAFDSVNIQQTYQETHGHQQITKAHLSTLAQHSEQVDYNSSWHIYIVDVSHNPSNPFGHAVIWHCKSLHLYTYVLTIDGSGFMSKCGNCYNF